MEKSIQIETQDGLYLSGRLFESRNEKGVCIINPAWAVTQRFYYRIARYLCENDITVVTFDYRGVGESLNKPIKNYRANMLDWAMDAESALSWAFQNFKEKNLFLLGHSFGGQCIGLIPSVSLYKKVIFVGAQFPSIKRFPFIMKIKLFILWKILIPFFTKMRGYFPSSIVGLGENVPTEVARQWAYWAQKEKYYVNEEKTYFDQIKADMLFYWFSDDAFAPKKAAQFFSTFLPQKKLTIKEYQPSDLKLKEIGHFNFFKTGFESTLWKEVLNFLM